MCNFSLMLLPVLSSSSSTSTGGLSPDTVDGVAIMCCSKAEDEWVVTK